VKIIVRAWDAIAHSAYISRLKTIHEMGNTFHLDKEKTELGRQANNVSGKTAPQIGQMDKRNAPRKCINVRDESKPVTDAYARGVPAK